MVRRAAALLDERLRPPRQGDGDEGRALLLDAPVPNRWPSLLALGGALFGRLGWWPAVPPDVGQHAGPARWRRPAAHRPRPARAAALALRRRRADPAAHRRPARSRRSGAAATAARTASSASPRTPTPTRCRSRSGTAAWTCSPTPAPTATTASRPGGPTSGPRSRTTPCELAGTEPVPRGRPVPLAAARGNPGDSSARDDGDAVAGPPSTTATRPWTRRPRHRRTVRLDRAAAPARDHRRGHRRPPAAAGLPPRPRRRGRARRRRRCAALAGAPPPRAAPGWSCPPAWSGACTAGRPSRSSAGTRRASGAGSRPSR